MLDKFVRNIVEKEGRSSISEIPIDKISVNPYQPRRFFDEQKLAELSQSIKEQGVIQPIIVRKLGAGFELVAGERRLRASKLASLSTIPAIVRNLGEQEVIEITFIENLQREQLNQVEEAEAFNYLVRERAENLDYIAGRVGKDMESIQSRLWLVKLPQVVKKAVVSKLISLDHARLISRLASEKKQIEFMEKIYREKMSLQQASEYFETLPSIMKLNEIQDKDDKEQDLSGLDCPPVAMDKMNACIQLLRQVVGAMRTSGIEVRVSELISEKSLSVKLTFPTANRSGNPEKTAVDGEQE